jgi:hypothetical protein
MAPPYVDSVITPERNEICTLGAFEPLKAPSVQISWRSDG